MTERDTVGKARLETLRARLQGGGLAMAAGSAFLPLLQFVAEQGASGKHACVEPHVQFYQPHVNPSVRRFRETHLRVVCALPSPCLRLVLLRLPTAALLRHFATDGWISSGRHTYPS